MTDLVEFKHSLSLHVQENKLIDDITELINKVPNLDKLRLDPELTIYVCNVIENIITKHDTKTIKKNELCVKILTTIFNLEESEVAAINKQIIFLSNNKAIKTVAVSKKFKKSMWNWVQKKLL